ncbi:MAG TPA: CpsD/CapB family tyrosine-protein kinase, partial [Candidatus Dorea gallistercoris]|nr:CpsD/CapB family tyrosine-protein kinase [Candidatus Dorea gallistercoris]
MKEIEIKQNTYTYEMREELKTLRTNIQFCGDDKRVLLLTSTVASEGKSTTALNLAISLAELGKKVMLVDADIRKSVMVSRLEVGKIEYGLSHFLAGQCQVSEAVYAVENIDKLYLMFSGPVVPNPTELLSTDRFEKMIVAFRKVYDYIIIDGP